MTGGKKLTEDSLPVEFSEASTQNFLSGVMDDILSNWPEVNKDYLNERVDDSVDLSMQPKYTISGVTKGNTDD